LIAQPDTHVEALNRALCKIYGGLIGLSIFFSGRTADQNARKDKHKNENDKEAFHIKILFI
jgi:hypothetical protein